MGFVKFKRSFMTYLLLYFIGLSICLIIYVLFTYPNPGVADQGDFDRVMSISGLELTEKDKADPNFNRFYKYIVTDYKISEKGVLSKTSNSSISYLIILINFICKMFKQNIFKTNYLAIAYSIIYIFSLYIIIRYINLKSKFQLVLLTTLILFVFLDGNYLVWFNSLYGEPIMMTTLLLYISSWIYYIYYKYEYKTGTNILPKIIFIFIASFLFIGSKMQVITALPIIITMLVWLLWENRYAIKRTQLLSLITAVFLLIAYPLAININNGEISRDTNYNSVFYGILKDSKTPREDLLDMDLNTDMSIDAGKHSYLNTDAYSKYVPHSNLTEKEFYSKINNGKLIKFYLTHPKRIILGMEYTANHAFKTDTSLGHYERSYSEEPIRKFNRFTEWSSLRGLLPKRLSFIFIVYVVILAISLFIYRKNIKSNEIKAKIKLLWSVITIGLFQLPMPYIGNGQADTSKQLFLFNFIFDMMLIFIVCFIFYSLTKIKYKKL